MFTFSLIKFSLIGVRVCTMICKSQIYGYCKFHTLTCTLTRKHALSCIRARAHKHTNTNTHISLALGRCLSTRGWRSAHKSQLLLRSKTRSKTWLMAFVCCALSCLSCAVHSLVFRMLTYVFVPCVCSFSSIVSSVFVGLLVLVVPSVRVSFYLSLCLFVRIVVFSRVYGVCLCASSIRLIPTGHCVHRWQGVCLPLPAPLNVYANPFFGFLLPFPICRVLSSLLSAARACVGWTEAAYEQIKHMCWQLYSQCVYLFVFMCVKCSWQMKKADESTLLGQMFALKPGTDKMLMEVHNS